SASAHGTILAQPGAEFIRLGQPPDEIVRLSQGTLTVEVSPLGAGERFRVITSDAEVEVRGTAFDVVAAADRLTAVRVHHGRGGHAEEAAAAFARALAADAHASIAEDAQFWLGVALARAGHAERSIAALTTFVESFPGSVRLGEASVILGRLLLDAGDLRQAE